MGSDRAPPGLPPPDPERAVGRDRQRHLPGRRLDPGPRLPRLPRLRPAVPGGVVGRHARQRPELRLQRATGGSCTRSAAASWCVVLACNLVGDALRDALRRAAAAPLAWMTNDGRRARGRQPHARTSSCRARPCRRSATSTSRSTPGETLGLVGESGCGKSMLGLSILGLLPNGGHDHRGLDQARGPRARRPAGRRAASACAATRSR